MIFFIPCDLEIWWMTLKNNMAPHPYYVKLCVSFQSHRWIQTWVTVWKRSIPVKIGEFFCPARPSNFTDNLEKQKGTSSILRQDLCIISKPSVNSNLGCSPETPNLGQNQRFFSRVTLRFDRWPWETIGHPFHATSSFVHHFIAIGNSNSSYSPETPNLGRNRGFF